MNVHKSVTDDELNKQSMILLSTEVRRLQTVIDAIRRDHCPRCVNEPCVTCELLKKEDRHDTSI